MLLSTRKITYLIRSPLIMNMLMLIVKEKLFKLKLSSLMRYMQTLTNFPQITHVCQTYVLCMCYYDSKRAGLLPPRFITDTL